MSGWSPVAGPSRRIVPEQEQDGWGPSPPQPPSRRRSPSPQDHSRRRSPPASSFSAAPPPPRFRSRSPNGFRPVSAYDTERRQPAVPRRNDSSGAADFHEGDEQQTISVTGLSRNVTARHLREIFAAYGQVGRVEILVYDRSGDPRGEALISFVTRNRRDEDSASRACSHMDQGQIDGAIVRVKTARWPRSSSRRSPPPFEAWNAPHRSGGADRSFDREPPLRPPADRGYGRDRERDAGAGPRRPYEDRGYDRRPSPPRRPLSPPMQRASPDQGGRSSHPPAGSGKDLNRGEAQPPAVHTGWSP